jgi:hypothetical protein
MALSIYIILLQALALVFVTNAIPLVSSSVGESEAFAARQARQIVQETGMAMLYNGRLAIASTNRGLGCVNTGIGTLVTVMDSSVNRDLESIPFGIMEYYADRGNGDLLLLMSDLQVSWAHAIELPSFFVSVNTMMSRC